MQTADDDAGIPQPVLRWVELVSGAPVVRAERVSGGLSRKVYRLGAVAGGRDNAELILILQASSEGQGNAHDARVLSLLAGTGISVPRVLGFDPANSALLMQRLAGESDFASLVDPGSRRRVTDELMRNIAVLHNLDVAPFAAAGLELPASGEQCACQQLQPMIDLYLANPALHDPLFEVAIRWLQAHVPQRVDKVSLVHGDIGPGNFLFDGSTMTGIVDWEIAHLGDAMEDLARICIRSMSVPMGELRGMLDEYARHSRQSVDHPRIMFYMLLTLVRSSLLIRKALRAGAPTVDAPQKFMYEGLLMRAASDVLLAAHGAAPCATGPLPEALADASRAWVFDSLLNELQESIEPLIAQPWARERIAWIKRTIGFLADCETIGPSLERDEKADIESLAKQRFDSIAEAEQQLARDAGAIYASRADAMVAYLSRRMARTCRLRRSLLGPLFNNRIELMEYP